MSTNDHHTFECTICNHSHNIIPDALPTGHSGHKPHCLFCLAHTLYRSIIPAAPAARPTPEQTEKNNTIKTRKLVIFTIVPVAVLAYFAFRWQSHFWARIARGSRDGGKRWEDRVLYGMLCMVGVAPCGLVLGFLVAVAYYTYWCLRRKRARRGGGDSAVEAGPPEDKPLVEVRYGDLREMGEGVSIVVTSPEEAPVRVERANRVSRMLGMVGDRFRSGYDGRGVRRESFALEEMGERREELGQSSVAGARGRPTTEWPVM